MRIIQTLSDNIEDELEDARKYIELALEYKLDNPETANLFYKLSNEEMTHMDMLHKHVVENILNYKREHGEPPVAMQAVYDHLHKRFMEQAAKITNLQAMYKK